jgi:hypothetical protein
VRKVEEGICFGGWRELLREDDDTGKREGEETMGRKLTRAAERG